MTRPEIEPRSPGPLANTLTATPINSFHSKYSSQLRGIHILQAMCKRNRNRSLQKSIWKSIKYIKYIGIHVREFCSERLDVYCQSIWQYNMFNCQSKCEIYWKRRMCALTIANRMPVHLCKYIWENTLTNHHLGSVQRIWNNKMFASGLNPCFYNIYIYIYI